jgi:AcrR family transcriptional regulator
VIWKRARCGRGPPERILRALTAVVSEKGYPETTVAEVVDRAKTSQRTFYEHFDNKEDAMVAALEQREVVTEGMEGLLAPGYELKPGIPPITAEAIGGALYALFYDHVKQKGAERLAEMVPLAVYVTLAPFIGAEEAFDVATG